MKKTTMKRREAVFAGAARDCEQHLPACLATLRSLSEVYDEASFIFVVSDSGDNTAELLRDWLTTGHLSGKVINLGDLRDNVPMRTERIAIARNTYMSEIAECGLDRCNHLVVVDLDDVLAHPVSVDLFAEAADWLDAVDTRAGVFANALPRYYDLWALRHPTWCPYDCWHVIWGRPPGSSFEHAKFREVCSRQVPIPTDLPPIPVHSAFGGLGIYRMSFAIDAKYGGVDWQGRQEAEHVAFNRAIVDAGGDLFIFPSLCVRAPLEHLKGPSSVIGGLKEAVLRHVAHRVRPPWRTLLGSPEPRAW